MIGHRRFTILAAGSIDFELSPGDRADLDRHIEACGECRDVAWRLRSDASAIAHRPRHEPPPDMRRRFERDWLPLVRRRRSIARPVLLAAAALLVVGTTAAIVGGGRFLEVPLVAPTEPPVEPTATPPNRLPAVGAVTEFPLSRGPVDPLLRCDLVHETACATDIVSAFDSVWTTTSDGVVRVDPGNGEVIAEINTGPYPIKLAADEAFIWVTLRGPARLVRIDAASNDVDAVFPLPGAPAGIATSEGSIWVVDEDSDEVLRINASDGSIARHVSVVEQPWSIAALRGSIWVANRWANQLVPIDVSTTQSDEFIEVPLSRPTNSVASGPGLATDGESLVIATNSRISRFDPSTGTFIGNVMPLLPTPVLGDSRMWIVSGNSALIQQLDPSTLDVIGEQTIQTQPSFWSGDWELTAAATRDAVWLRVYARDSLIRIQLAK